VSVFFIDCLYPGGEPRDRSRRKEVVMASDAYRDAGVDIEAGYAVVKGIKEHVVRTQRPEVLGGLGGFGGLFALSGKYRDPVLVSGTDGVGTKLLVAQTMGQHETIGIDLVAMCANDIVMSGAEPLFFLDYFATGKLSPEVTVEVVAGIAEGCVQAGCALIGGETAEMPGMYAPGHYDLAGFCVGVVEREGLIDGSRVKAGDSLVGVPSSGIHSNGFSLVRKVVDGLDWAESYGLGAPLGEVLLRPTRIYVQVCQTLMRDFDVRSLVHITGGGFHENIPRGLPAGLGVVLNKGSWPIPPIFGFLAERGNLSDADMENTFNNGLGMIAVVSADVAEAAAAAVGGHVVGTVVEGAGVEVR
jgi:phosphoribosylformylglycinamidine cyclo-ligase